MCSAWHLLARFGARVGIIPLRSPQTPSSNKSWQPDEMVCQRERLSLQWIKGKGIEIGALHKPLPVREDVSVRYVDYKTLEENRSRYPELKDEKIVTTDIVEEGFTLNSVPQKSINFIVANHALEHSPDPYGTLLNWKSKLLPKGVLYMAVPIADTCFDRGRPLTTLDHLLADHQDFKECRIEQALAVTREHIHEFLQISDANIRRENGLAQISEAEIEKATDLLIEKIVERLDKANITSETLMLAHILGLNREYDIHYHTFSPESLTEFMNYFAQQEGLTVKALQKSGSGECITILEAAA